VDHVTLTLEDVTAIIRTLMRGELPARQLTIKHPPLNAARPLADLVARLRASHHLIAGMLGSAVPEPHIDLRVPEHDFGEINWKGYALVLRLHYKDHAEQVRRTAAALARGPSTP
jgi:hypothetical protein